MPPQFRRGDSVEIADAGDGLDGSYYSATIITPLMKQEYIVQYHHLTNDDESGPLREIVTAAKIRPEPPEIRAVEFRRRAAVDALHEEGWWVGKITGKIGGKYWVYFESTGEEIAYGVDELRVHQEWVNGKWIS